MQLALFSPTVSYAPSASVDPTALYVRDPNGVFVPADTSRVLDAARQIAHQVLPERINMSRPQQVKEFFAMKLNSNLEHEIFGMTMLDAQYRLIEYVEPFRGTLTQASVYPREVVKMALAANAAAVIIAHNHLSGTLEPSAADLNLTKHLRTALALVDIRLLDHILVAGNKTLSFAESGQL